MSVKRRSHNLDERLLHRAQRVLGTSTETETIHQALRAVVRGDELIAALESVAGRVQFRTDFVRAVGGESVRGGEITARVRGRHRQHSRPLKN
jgi:Arc/MetJ family transcription regulator